MAGVIRVLAGGPDREDRAGRKARPELEYSRVRQGWPLCCDTTNRLHGVAPGRLDLSLSSHESGRDGWAPALRRLPLQRAKRCIAQRLSFTASSWAPWAQQTRRAALRDRGAGRLSESRVPAPHRKCKHQAGAQLSALHCDCRALRPSAPAGPSPSPGTSATRPSQ